MIRRILFLIPALILLAGCKSDKPQPRFSVDPGEVILRSESGSQGSFTVTANRSWSAVITGEGFSVHPTQGDAGETIVTVTASRQSSGRGTATLGNISLILNDNTKECNITVSQRPGVAAQTVLLYMTGRDLLNYYRNNIQETRNAISADMPGEGRMLICYQPTSAIQAEMYEVYYDAKEHTSTLELLKTYTDFNAGDPASVGRMLADVAELAPADRYGMIIGCHGKAWVPAASGTLKSAMMSIQEHEEIWTLMPGALPTRSFGDSRYEIDIPVFAEALSAQSYRMEYLFFDACFMANIETLYDLRACTDYVIAAPCEIMAYGFPYERMVPTLFTQNGKGRDLQRSCEVFYDFYLNSYSTKSGCISLAVMAELEALADIMREINAGPQKTYNEVLQYYEGMSTHLFYDLGHWVELACNDEALKSRFREQLDKAFPEATRLNTPGYYSGYNNRMNTVTYYSGVSFSAPSTKYAVENKQTNWYLVTH